MTGKILYCESCGKLIPPEEAEAEDFEIIGGAPVCPRCLEKKDPKRKELFDTARSTRLMKQVDLVLALKQARPPEQTFPPPGTEMPDSPTSTEIRAIRDELDREWEEDGKRIAKKAGPAAQKSESKIKAPSAASNPAVVQPKNPDMPAAVAEEPTTGVFPVLPRQTKLAVGAMLVFSLALLIALLAYVSSGTPRTTAAPEPAPPAEPPLAPEAKTQPEPEAAKPPVLPAKPAARDVSYVETLESVLGERPDRETLVKAIEELRKLAESPEPETRAAAEQALARCVRSIDADARQAAREAAEGARELAEQQLYTLAAQRIAQAVAALPEGSPWARQAGKRSLQAVNEELAAQKEQALVEVLEKIEGMVLEGKTAEAEQAVLKLRGHPEPEFQKASAHVLKLLENADEKRRAVQKRMEEAARVAWPKFFKDLDEALAAGDLARAAALCKPPADSVLRAGGIEGPAEVLDGFGGEVEGLAKAYEAALKAAAAAEGAPVNLPAGMGASRGTLKGVDERNLVVQLDNRAEMKIPVEKLAPLELERLLVKQKVLPAAQYRPAVWLLFLARGGAEAEPGKWIAEQYAADKRALPPHWRRRVELGRAEARIERAAERMAALRKALAEKDEGALRAALAALKPALAESPESFTAADRELIAQAEKSAGAGKIKHLVFQNGQQPSTDYVGIQIDQINKYYRNEERTDVDVHEGLKVGSHNDLQRVLIRFDGLEASLGRGRIRKATLELYQTDATKAAGAVVGLYRLKKPWMPNAGSWKNADQRKRLPWDKPGASGPEDAADQAEAQVTLDDRKELWRSWDVTAYVTEIAAGKAFNHGLLMRVVKDEPKFDLSFYPDGDLDTKKDPILRPRLVVEIETQE
ncbi:MAG: DNRLRE domain-containing protein [Planctomycetota bacterium]|nr:DNRLRE domain-containing protein [Planctomycetota bacterium]